VQQPAVEQDGSVPRVTQAPWARLPVAALGWGRASAGIVVRTVQLYIDDHCTTYAAAIAYYAIFSLVPLLLVTVSAIGLLVEQETLTDFMFEQLPIEDTPSMRKNVADMIQRAREAGAAGIGAGIVGVLWSASGIFAAVRRGLNRAMGRTEGRPFWRGKLVDLAQIPTLGLLLILTMFGTSIVQILVEEAARWGPFDFNESLALSVGTFAVTTVVWLVAFALLYRYIPNPHPGWKQAIFSAAFAILLFDIARLGAQAIFVFMPFTRDTAIYAGFGTILTLLLYIFITANIILLGAEFGRAVRDARGTRDLATASFLRKLHR
jgi:membrane protein